MVHIILNRGLGPWAGDVCGQAGRERKQRPTQSMQNIESVGRRDRSSVDRRHMCAHKQRPRSDAARTMARTGAARARPRGCRRARRSARGYTRSWRRCRAACARCERESTRSPLTRSLCEGQHVHVARSARGRAQGGCGCGQSARSAPWIVEGDREEETCAAVHDGRCTAAQ